MTPAQLLAVVRLTWPAELVEEFEERAALVQHGCNVTREESERRAYEMLKARAG